jgi:type IV pilus assembly protein PilQ
MCCAATNSSAKESVRNLQETIVITGIDIQDNMVKITADKPFIYTIYKPGDPYKIIVDLPDVTLGAFNKKISSDKIGITEIVPSQIESPSLMARIEILIQTPSFEQEYRNNVLTVKLKEDTPMMSDMPVKSRAKDMPAKMAENPAPAPFTQKSLAKATEISSISFDTTADSVRVLIKGNGSMIPNVFPLDDRIVIDIDDVVNNASVPSGVISPVKGIRAGKHEDKTRVVIDLKEKTNFDVSAVGDTIVVTLKKSQEEPAVPLMAQMPAEKEPVAEASEMKSETRETETFANGKCVSYVEGKENVNFDFQDQDIVPIFRLFADISGCNLFVHPDVKGKATMKFRNVPWNQALDTILKTFSLGKSVEGNIIRIAPNTVFVKESEETRKAEKAKQQTIEEMATLERKTFHLMYANAEEVKKKLMGYRETLVKDEITKELVRTYSYEETTRELSPRGSAIADKISNVLVVIDIPTKLAHIEDFIREIDQPIRQVMIEARIVEVNTNSERELGIQWGLNLRSTNTLASLGGLSGIPFLTPMTIGGNYLVDLPAQSVSALSGSGFTFGILNPARTIGLEMQLTALETTGNGKVISNPRIMTMNEQPAKILQGKSIPVRKLTTEGTISTEFKDVNLELNVTPSITLDKTVSLDINIKKEELDPTIPSIEGVPGTDKKEAKTKVRIQDGETVVIGGLYKINTADTETGVPGLMKIPILKWFFKKEKTTTTTSELMIFITPRIVLMEQK